MIFRQLIESTSLIYAYPIGYKRTGPGCWSDPVYDTIEHALALIQDPGLELAYMLDTHMHAYHLSGASKAKGLWLGAGALAPAPPAVLTTGPKGAAGADAPASC